ncbi:MAG TPA: LysR family transcriptional regulator [Kofleriaceae bacterium]|nr:LysR family transcriptional regulator [Kofleriaceae bacterium]
MDLNHASAFVRVVETGGFTRAAAALGVPPSSVSRRVARLEAELGVRLLERTTRSIALTDAGRAYYERVREALAGLAEAGSLALDAAREVRGVVRVALPVEIAASAGSLLAGFLGAHPQVRLEVAFTNRGAELAGDGVDVAVVCGRLPDSSLVARKLATPTARLYAAPAYVARRGKPRTLAELANHDTIHCLASSVHPHLRALAGVGEWELVGPRGPERVELAPRIVADHHQFVLDAALAGLGIALLPTWFGDRHVRTDALVAVLPRHAAHTPLLVLTAAGRYLPHRVALLRDYLVEMLAKRF